jgi:hypothetical protein
MNNSIDKNTIEGLLNDLPEKEKFLISDFKWADNAEKILRNNNVSKSISSVIIENILYFLLNVLDYDRLKEDIEFLLEDIVEQEQIPIILADIKESVIYPIKGKVLPNKIFKGNDIQAHDREIENKSLNHADILREIEDPAPSIKKSDETTSRKTEGDPQPEPEKEYEDYDSLVHPTTDLEIQNQTFPRDDISIDTTSAYIDRNSIHHDIGINMTNFKPIPQDETEQKTSARSSEILKKLDDKLSETVVHQKQDVMMPKTEVSRPFDPYREPIE